ncbi:hypothetical protein NQ317_011111, partial [Molorchus minor]
ILSLRRITITIDVTKMDTISDVVIKPLEKSIYMKPFTMHFTQNGTKRTWDLLSVHDSVAIIIYNITRDVLIFVKQFRPAVYFGTIPEEERKVNAVIDTQKYPAELGITIELCAGIVDKNLPLAEIAKEEVLEECGYNVPVRSLEKIGSYRSGVGTLGSIQTAFYCEVTDEMKVSEGGGVDDEIIDIVEMKVDEVRKYISQENIRSPPSFMFGIYWFLYHKVKQRIH